MFQNLFSELKFVSFCLMYSEIIKKEKKELVVWTSSEVVLLLEVYISTPAGMYPLKVNNKNKNKGVKYVQS